MHRTFTITAILILALSIFTGCQDNPAFPGIVPDSTGTASLNGTVNPHTCLGYYALSIDTASGTPTILPVRSAGWHLNITGVLNATMGISAAGVPGESDIANGLVVLDITLTHPFGSKPQLSGFDVKGILITPGTLQINPSLEPGLLFAGPGETQLENADGATRWWNPTEFTQPGMFGYTHGKLANAGAAALTATVNPYKYFADALYPENNMSPVHGTPLDDNLGRGVFRAGESNTRRYRIRFPMNPGPQVVYGYAVDASWVAPSPNPPVEIPDDFPFEANCPEAYDLTLTELANTLYFDSESGASGGAFRLQVNVYDWQGQNNGNIDAEVDEVLIYSPELFPGAINAVFVDENATRAKYFKDMTFSATPAHSGQTLVAVRVPIDGTTTYDQGVAPAPDSRICAWATMMLDIPDPECAPDANNDWSEATELEMGDQVEGQVCLPDDYRDFFTFTVPPGSYATGEVRLYCDAVPTKLTTYDETQAVIQEEDIASGLATVTMNEVPPGTYFLRVWTSNDSQVSPYFLELDGELVNAEPSDVTDVTPENLFMRANRAWTYGDYAIFKGLGCWVYDMTDPANPAFVSGKTRPENWTGTPADFSYPYLYYEPKKGTGTAEVRLIDFTDFSAPVYHDDIIPIPGVVKAICMNSEDLYIGSTDGGVYSLSIYNYSTDPLNPALLSTFSVPEEIEGLALIDPEGTATTLVVASETKIYTYGVEDPDWLVIFGNAPLVLGYTFNDMLIIDDYIIVADVDSADHGYLDTYESTLTGPVFSFGKYIPGIANDINLNEPYIYVASGPEGIVTLDYTNPASPVTLSTVGTITDAEVVAAGDDYLCLLPYASTMATYDLTDPENPLHIDRLVQLNFPQSGIAFKDNFMIVADATRPYSIKVLDISDPSNAYIYSENPASALPVYMAFYGNLIAAGVEDDVMLYDATDLSNITLLYYYVGSTDDIRGLYIYENCLYYLYYTSPKTYIRTINVSNPGAPSVVNTISFDDSGYNEVRFYNHTMYVSGNDGIRIYNVTSPTMPDFVDLIPASSFVSDIEISDNWLFVFTYGTDIVKSYDISNPIAPVLVGTGANGTTSAQEMAIDGQFAYFTGNNPTIHACWIYPPDSIVSYGTVFLDPYAGFQLVANEGCLYKLTLGNGLRIFDLY